MWRRLFTYGCQRGAFAKMIENLINPIRVQKKELRKRTRMKVENLERNRNWVQKSEN